MATTASTSSPKKLAATNSDIVVDIVERPAGQGHGFAFVPASIAILPGTTVIWDNVTNTDQTLVSSVNGVFSPASRVLKNGSLKMTFAEAETISYISKEHPEAKGTLLVQPATAAVAVKLMEQTGTQGVGYVLSPAGMVIKVGTTVTWNNETRQEQMLAGDKTNMFSAASSIAQGSSYKMVFSTPGTYNYYSKTSPTTRGVIVVVA
jgi:plastocyanin